jgi:ABC-2 type transport system ATP-binding protein
MGTYLLCKTLNFLPAYTQVKNNDKNKEIEKMISLFALEPYLNTSTKDLPLGFKQRLALACCLMHQPQVLFLDEPTY